AVSKSKTAGPREEPGRCELISVCALESLLQADEPEPAFDRGNRFVVAVLKVTRHVWRIFVSYVLNAQSDRRVVEPPSPVVAAVLGRGYWNHILLLALLAALHVFAAVLGKAGHLCGRRRWQVKRVI